MLRTWFSPGSGHASISCATGPASGAKAGARSPNAMVASRTVRHPAQHHVPRAGDRRRRHPVFPLDAHVDYKGRIGDAFLHTIWRHDDSGGMMPAYSEFLGDYGAAAVSRAVVAAAVSSRVGNLHRRIRHDPGRCGHQRLQRIQARYKRWLHLSR